MAEMSVINLLIVEPKGIQMFTEQLYKIFDCISSFPCYFAQCA